MAYAKQTNKAQAMKNEHLRHGYPYTPEPAACATSIG